MIRNAGVPSTAISMSTHDWQSLRHLHRNMCFNKCDSIDTCLFVPSSTSNFSFSQIQGNCCSVLKEAEEASHSPSGYKLGPPLKSHPSHLQRALKADYGTERRQPFTDAFLPVSPPKLTHVGVRGIYPGAIVESNAKVGEPRVATLQNL